MRIAANRIGAFAEALGPMAGDVVSLHGAQPIAPHPNQTLVRELERLLEAARSGEIIGMAGSYWHRNSTATYSYVGMVGSRTKRARFASWFRGEGGSEAALGRLVLPIGAFGLVDKRPEVIAALAAAEIMVQIGRREASVTAPDANSSVGAAVD